MIPIICNACGGSFRTASLLDLHCGCGSSDVDLDPREAALIEADSMFHSPDDDKKDEDEPNPLFHRHPRVTTDPYGRHTADALTDGMHPDDLYSGNDYDETWGDGVNAGIQDAKAGTTRFSAPEGVDDPGLWMEAYEWGIRNSQVVSSRRRTAAVGSGPGYYVLSHNRAIAGPFATLALARDAAPTMRGDAVQYLTSPERVDGLSGSSPFITPSGYSPFGDEPIGAFSGGAANPAGRIPAAFGAKIGEITAGLMETNQFMSLHEAQAIAERTVMEFPGVVKQADYDAEDGGDSWRYSPHRDRAKDPLYGDQTSCKICQNDIEYHGEDGKSKPGDWIDRGGNSTCPTFAGYDQDGVTQERPAGQKHEPYSDFATSARIERY